jgi:hypothetical protein
MRGDIHLMINKPESHDQKCQIQSMAKMGNEKGFDAAERLPFQKRARLALRRNLSLNFKRRVKRILLSLKTWWENINRNPNISTDHSISLKPLYLIAGECVRVRTKEEIQATLNPWNELKGCAFISEMGQYCGTTQRIFKLVERFVDERDYRVKYVLGVVLLEGVNCNGTSFYGKCDRTCFFFWREEWLERLQE